MAKPVILGPEETVLIDPFIPLDSEIDFVDFSDEIDEDDIIEVDIINGNEDIDGDGNLPFALDVAFFNSFSGDAIIYVNDSDDLIPGVFFDLTIEVLDSFSESASTLVTVEVLDDGGGGSDDNIDIEPNDDVPVDLGILQGLNIGQGSIDLFSDGDFLDLYQFEITEFTQSGNFIDLEFDGNLFSGGDLDLELYYEDPELGPVYQTGSFGTGDFETIDLSFYSPGIYYIAVYNADELNENDIPYELVISLPFGDTAPPGDEFESNDFFEEAAELNIQPGTNTYQAQLTNYYNLDSGFFGYVYDEDVFVFELTEDGKLGNSVTIDYDNSLGTLYLELYDEEGFYIDSGFPSAGEASISLWGLEAGTYYVDVYGWDINPIDYNLTIDAPSEGGGGTEDAYETNDTFDTPFDLGTLQGNFNLEDNGQGKGSIAVEREDEDWFTFTTSGNGKSGDKITVDYDAEVGFIGLELYDEDEFFLDFDYDDDFDGQANISLQGLEAGTYSVLVYGFGFEDLEYNLSFKAPTDGGTPDDNDDRYEQNDSFDAAKSLDPTNNTTNSKLKGLNTYEDLIIASNDEDWFSFTTDAGDVTVRIDFEHDKGDLDLELYNADNNLIRSSEGIDNVEDLTENLEAGTYYVRVLGFLGASNDNYTLTLETPDDRTGGTPTDDSYEENDTDQQLIATPDARANLREIQGTRIFDNLALLDDDWFSFKLATFGEDGNKVQIDFDNEKGDLDLQLFYDSNNDGKALELVDESNEITDTEEISLANLEPDGTYYVRVFGYAGATNNNYKLTIDAPKTRSGLQPDIFEVNDTPQQATELRQASQLQRLNINAATDRDWFEFDLLANPGANDRATIEFANSSGNLDLFLYTVKDGVDAPTSVDDLVLLRNSEGDGDSEEISLYGFTPDKYYLQIVGKNGTNPDYTLNVTGPIGIEDEGGTTDPTVREDSFEPNNTQNAASDLGTIKGKRIVGTEDEPLTIHQIQAGDRTLNRVAESDEDWFKFTNQFAGTVEVKIEFDNNEGNLDLEFLDAEGNIVGKARTNKDTESISLEDLAAGQYFIRVNALNLSDQFGAATTNTYKLEIETAAGNTILPDALEENDTLGTATAITRNVTKFTNLTIDQSDEDWFKFTTAEAGTKDNKVSINYDVAGKLDLQVKNADGEVVDLPSETFDAYEQISLEGLAEGTYYLQVVGTDGATNRKYTLDLNAPRSPEEISDGPDGSTTAGDTWTIFVYLAADNDLEEYALRDINEMESIQLPDNVNIVVQVDRASEFDTSNGDWQTTRRGRIQYDTDESIINSPLEDIGETNTGESATLQEFIEWGAQNYPADRYGVVIWNHGSGLTGTSYDNLSGGNLAIAEATQAFTDAKDSEGNSIELSLIGFDACLQGIVEQAYDIGQLTDVMVASQDLEPGNGWNYKIWLDALANNPRLSSEELGAQIVNAYAKTYNNRQTLAAIRMGEDGASIEALKEAIDGLTSALLADPSTENIEELTKARYASRSYYNPYNIDLGQFMDNIGKSGAADAIKTAAAAVREALNAVVIDQVDSRGASGLSIYVPQSNSNQFDYYIGKNFKFVEDEQWRGFIRGLSGEEVSNINLTISNRITADNGETSDLAGNYIRANNNNANDAYDLGRLVSTGNNFTGLSLHEAGDIDWYKFDLPVSPSGEASEKLSLTFDSALGDLNIELYSADDLTTPLVTATDTDNGKELSFAGLSAAGQYFLKVSGATANTTNPSYTITVDAPQPSSEDDSGDWAERNDTFEQAVNLGTIRQNQELRFPGLSMNRSDAVSESAQDEQKQPLSAFTDDLFDPDLLAQGRKVFKDSSFLKEREVGDWFVIEPIKATDLNPNTVTINFDTANGDRDLNLFLFREAPENGQLEFFDSSLGSTHAETESLVAESVSFPEQNNPIYVYVEGNIVPNYEIVVARRQIDLDGNGEVNAFTDGRILLGALQNQDAETLANYTGDGSSRTFGDELSNYLQVARTTLLDVDGNGVADADTDGNIILGYLFNYDPEQLAALVGENATRTTGAQLQQFLEQFFPGTEPPGVDSNIGASVAASSFSTVAVESGESLFGDDSDNHLTGGAGNDLIVGGAGKDTIIGNEGDDSLYAGNGDDLLNGDAGADTFVFGDETGNDTVEDFVVGQDLIQVNTSVGFSDSNALLAALSNNGQSSILTFSDGNTVTIFSDEALTAANFVVV